MSGFKLIGIQTKDRISLEEDPSKSDYLKILKENTFYSFYSCFDYKLITKSLYYYPEEEVELYSSELSTSGSKTNLSISAIVGKNGAGKSTIIEFLFLAFHNIASHCGILNNPDDETLWHTETGVKLDLLYQINNTVYCIRLDDFDITISSVELERHIEEYTFNDFQELEKSHLPEFFYSIAINYSIYSLNTNHVGDWIRALFHKNDGYQTPVVINPMREKGNIDINREEYLSKSRLLANLLLKSTSNEHLNLTSTQKVVDLRFELNRKKVENLYENKRLKVPIIWTFEKLYSDYSTESDLLELIYTELINLDRDIVEVPFKIEIEKYIVKKLFKIAKTYESYKKYLDDKEGLFIGRDPTVYSTGESIQPSFYNLGEKEENADRNLKNYIRVLKEDKSHITFKLNQAINYLKSNPLFEEDTLHWRKAGNTSILDISIVQLSERISKTVSSEIINFLPPSLFNVEIFLEEIVNPISRSKFGDLSSGEQQLIQSIQSVVYHINNLNSVFENNSEDIKYPYINIILDEIELYFHPDFQRLFVSTLIDNLKKAHLGNIEGINILFSTHSPFILSDIPSSNILRLKKGEPKPEGNQSFGANIHDLLANNFFLGDGFMGGFAKSKIDSLIDFLKSNKGADVWNAENSLNVINLIGEDLIKQILLDLYYIKFSNKLDEQIEHLSKLKLKNDINR